MTQQKTHVNLRIPGPTPVPDDILQAVAHPMVNHRGKEFAGVIERVAAKLKDFFITRQDVMILSCSGSGGLEAAVVNTLSPGDKVLAVTIGAFGERLATIAEVYGADVTVLPYEWGQAAHGDDIRHALKENPEIKAVLITHNETSTGVTNPLAQIAEVVREFDKLLVVDAVSSLGAIPCEVDAWGLDCVVTGSQKGWMVPPGLAFACLSDRGWKAYEQARMPRFYFDLGKHRDAQSKGQTPFTPAMPIFFGLDVALERMALEGMESIFTRHKKAAADLERAQATFEFASKDLARARDLRIKRSISQQDYDLVAERERISAALLRAAQFEQQVAVHELEMARAALLRTHSSPGERMAHRLEIPSPIRGRVLRVFQESEAVVTPGTRLLELGDPTDLEIEIDVLSADAVKIKPGAKVYLEHWGGPEPLLARVRLVEPAGFLKISALGVEEQRVWVIADFVDPPEKRPTLGDAYRVEARIVTWEEEGVLKVPAGALFRKGDGWAVYRAANGRAVLRSVTVGQSNALEAQILDGLSEGERVIVHPSDKVKDGVAIQSR